jgi:hypothetical protein
LFKISIVGCNEVFLPNQFVILIRKKLLPFAMRAAFPHPFFTAFPVNSGFSDYYGSSVALPDIQRHLTWQSLVIYPISALRIAFLSVLV